MLPKGLRNTAEPVPPENSNRLVFHRVTAVYGAETCPVTNACDSEVLGTAHERDHMRQADANRMILSATLLSWPELTPLGHTLPVAPCRQRDGGTVVMPPSEQSNGSATRRALRRMSPRQARLVPLDTRTPSESDCPILGAADSRYDDARFAS